MIRLDTYLACDENEEKIQLSYEEMAYRYAFNNSGNIVYMGKAIAGATSASSVWQIKKFMYDTAANNNISACLWASGTRDYSSAWTDRTTITFL